MNIQIINKRDIYVVFALLCVVLFSACQAGYQVHVRTSDFAFSEIPKFDSIFSRNSHVFVFEKVEGEKYYKKFHKKYSMDEGAVYVSSLIVCTKGYSTGICEEFEIVTGAMREVNRDNVRKEIESISTQLIDELKSIVGEENVEVTITKMGPPII